MKDSENSVPDSLNHDNLLSKEIEYEKPSLEEIPLVLESPVLLGLSPGPENRLIFDLENEYGDEDFAPFDDGGAGTPD